MSARRILVLFAHPSLERSQINRKLTPLVRDNAACTFVDLYAEYPSYRIDIDKEQQRLLEHDVVVFLFPLFWYSTPALLKEWQDLVLEHGFAYGNDGDALLGKFFICACSAGGPDNAYANDGFNRFTLRELLRPLEQTANLCKMRYLPPFALYGSRTALEEGRLAEHEIRFSQLLNHLSDSDLSVFESEDDCTINQRLDDVVTQSEAAQ